MRFIYLLSIKHVFDLRYFSVNLQRNKSNNSYPMIYINDIDDFNQSWD